jgi:hypothetical protein
MKNAFAALPVLLALLAPAQVSVPARSQGRITGILLYPNGTPVARGKVLLTGARPNENPTEDSTETDQDGRFEFVHLRFTNYWFGASKEDEAYGDGEAVSVRGGEKLTNPTGVKLTSAAPTSDAVLKLGPKWGILSGMIEDQGTHEPVVARLRFAEQVGRGRNEPHYLKDFFTRNASGSFRVLVPPATDYFLQVNADGYKPWFYPDGLGTVVFLEGHRIPQPLPLRFESGEQKSLQIELEMETSDRIDGLHP